MKPFEAMKSLVARAENAGDKKTTLEVLRDARGCFRPGTLTLVLAPPGHGKSTLLKSIAGVNPLPIEGEITYSGLTKKELEAKGVSLHRLCEYVTQLVWLEQIAVFRRSSDGCALASPHEMKPQHRASVRQHPWQVSYERFMKISHRVYG